MLPESLYLRGIPFSQLKKLTITLSGKKTKQSIEFFFMTMFHISVFMFFLLASFPPFLPIFLPPSLTLSPVLVFILTFILSASNLQFS